MMTMIWYPGPY